MNLQSKPFIISLLIEGLIALVFWQSWWLWFNNDTIFWNHIIERILISIIRPIIWLTRNSKEKNTKLLKKWLIILEIYLFLLIFIQDWSNLNKREFSILFITILLILKETIYKRHKKRQTIFLISIYTIISCIIICTWMLMWYRNPININSIIDTKNYYLITNFSGEISNTNNITLKNDFFNQNINTTEWKTNYNLIKNMDYTIEFSSNVNDENNYIIIQDQLWNILKIPPQTSISFSTKNKQIRYIDNNRRCSYYSISEKFPTELEEYKTTYNDTLKNDILGTLPSMLRDNSKLQKISTNYTRLLWTIFPFRYHKNVNILNEYIPYFNLDWKKEYESVNNWYSILRENEKIWLKNINWWDKYKFF